MTSPSPVLNTVSRSSADCSDAGPGPGSAIIALQEIRKTYFKPDGSVMVEALRGVDISIEPGEYVAIMGASGSGKSTLLNVLGCLDRPTSGRYYLDGRDVARMNDDDISRYRGRKIGFIFQAFNLIPELTIVENIEVPLFYQGIAPAQRRETAIEMLSKVGLDERTDHRPSELSGGQQQRVAIARALAMRPAVLLGDEPTGNLDSKTGRDIQNLFQSLHEQGITILVVTHDPNVAQRCKRIIRLADGFVVEDRPVVN
ncbi:MAG: ABC transporter ATP-binding protein [Planctomycetes bacterium]|nr:ABC transporter ATP-binding protein [Planctomycetota bacterium]